MRSPRGRGCLAESVALHGLLVLGLAAVPARSHRTADEPRPTEVVFYQAPADEPEAIAPPEPAEPEPEPAEVPGPVEIAKVEPPPKAPEPPRPRPVVARNEPPPPPKVEPVPRPARVVVRTEAFKTVESPVAERAVPARAVARDAGFEVASSAPRARKPEVRLPASGGFGDGAVAATLERESKHSGSVTRAGFGATVTAAPAVPAAREEQGDVRRGSFGEIAAKAAASPRPARPAADPDTAVEIVSKATPSYTDEARRLRVEGAVVLEVSFEASGTLRILRVLEGLGHGLDEAAVEAAKQTRFKPARRDGRPVDHTATLRVVFRLA